MKTLVFDVMLDGRFIHTFRYQYCPLFPIDDYKCLSTIVNEMIFLIFALAKHLDIDLIWHVEQKMRYNELRPKLNEKKY